MGLGSRCGSQKKDLAIVQEADHDDYRSGQRSAETIREQVEATPEARATVEDVITVEEPVGTRRHGRQTDLKRRLADYGDTGKDGLESAWAWASDLVTGRHRYQVLPAGVCFLRALGLLVAVISPVYPIIDLEIGGLLGWLLNVAANVGVGFLTLVGAEALATLCDLADSADRRER